MQRAGRRFHTLAGTALVAAMLAALGLVSGARAQTDNQLASITLYAFICPVGYTGDEHYQDCSGNPGANITFILDETETSPPTDANGRTAFEGINVAGEHLVQIDVPGDFTDFVADCVDEFAADFAFEYATAVGGILLDLTLDDDIRCDFYIIPESQSGITPTATGTATATATATATPTRVTLPSTGTGLTGDDGGTFWPLAGALALTVVAGIALGRARLARAEARGRQ